MLLLRRKDVCRYLRPPGSDLITSQVLELCRICAFPGVMTFVRRYRGEILLFLLTLAVCELLVRFVS